MASRLCPACRRTFPRGTPACPDHGKILRDDPMLETTLSGHRVTGWLGEGLYTATDRRSGAPLGVRVVDPKGARGPGGDAGGLDAAGLLAELRTASALSDGAALQPLDGGTLPDGMLYYLFAWPRRGQAEPLRHLLQRAPRPLPETVDVGIALCRAVGAAHRVGLVHGLLSGESVLVQRSGDATLGPQAFLLDLGLQRRLLRSAAREARDDVHAIGALLYQLATGSPVQATTAFAGREDLPAEFEAVVLRALAQRREDRHPSVTALQKDLEALQREVRRAPPARPSRAVQLLPLFIAGASGVALAAMVLLVLLRPGAGILPQPQPAPGLPDPGGPGAPRPSPPGAGPEALRVAPALRAQALAVQAEAQRSPEPQQRWQAAHIIGLSGDRRLRLPAEDLLGDVEPRVAAHAAWALGQLGDRAAVVALGQAAGDRHVDLEAGVALTQLGDRRGLDLLRGVLRGKGGRERMEAALWLGENNEEEAWRALRRMLQISQDEDPLGHLTLLGRLCRGRDQAACQQLRERIGGQPGLKGRARLIAGTGLMEAGDPLGFEVLRALAREPPLRLQALRALAEAGLDPEDERWLAALVADQTAAVEDQAAAAEALGRAVAFGALPQLQGALFGERLALRWAAAAAVLRLSWLEPASLRQRAIDWAPAGLCAPRAATRAAAAAALTAAPAALSTPLLIGALADRDADVRAAAVTALGEVAAAAASGERAAALAALGPMVSDREGAVRVAAIGALGRLGAKEPAAQAMLREQGERGGLLEQVAAAGWLLRQGGTGRHVLRQALGSPDVAVRLLSVREALRDPDEGQRSGLLLQALGDVADDVRLVAAVGLARLGDRRGLESLRGYGGLLLGQRLLARDALARLREPLGSFDVVAALGAAGEGQRVGAMAVAPELLPETALSLLRRGLRDIAPPVRLAAVAAIGSAPLSERQRAQLLLQVIGDGDEAVQARAAALLGDLLGR